MKSLTNKLNDLANKKVEKYHTPFSLRLSFDQRGLLEHDAAGQALGAYTNGQNF